MRLSIDEAGDVTLDMLAPELIAVFSQIPELLQSQDAAVRASQQQRTYEDDAEEAQWQRLVQPELEHLFADRAEIVRSDLQDLEPDETALGTLQMQIKAPRRQAWIAALNGANHALMARAGLSPADLEERPGTLGDLEKDRALASIELFCIVLHALLQVDGHGFPDRETVDGWREEDHPDGTED